MPFLPFSLTSDSSLYHFIHALTSPSDSAQLAHLPSSDSSPPGPILVDHALSIIQDHHSHLLFSEFLDKKI